MMKRYYKICVLLLMVVLILSETNATPNLTVLATINGYYKTFYCVTNNDSSALTWVTPTLNENPPSRYISGNVDISCDMDPQQQCYSNWIKGQWYYANSLDFSSGPIFDHRWERFKVIETGAYYEVISNKLNHDDFEIPFSIRIEKDANIYLCDGKDPPEANCYWFILSGWKATSNVIRKCAKNEIPESQKKFPDPPCNVALDQKNDTESRVKKSEWTHFVLKRNQLTYTLRKHGEREPFLRYTDTSGSAFQPDHLIIKSRDESEGVWKFHLYSFLLTTHQEKIQLGPWIMPENGTICVAFFTKMCENCKLHLSLVNSSSETIHVQIYQNTEWTEIKFLAKNLFHGYYMLHVTTLSNDSNRFWALDDVRGCTENDVRFTQIESRGDYFPSYACYSLGASTFKIDLKSLKDIKTSGFHCSESLEHPLYSCFGPIWDLISRSVARDFHCKPNRPGQDSSCPESTFGRSCIPCNNILSADFCDNYAICEATENETTKCTCAAGFHGTKCEKKCQTKFYGFGCKQSCGQCRDNTCNHIDGTCNSCKKGYSGDTCKIPRVPVLKHDPVVVNVSHTSMVIQLQDNEYIGQSIPTYYIICYKHDQQNEWQQTEEFHINNLSPKEINGLIANTKYIVWVLLRSTNEDYNEKFAKKMEVTTTCASFSEGDIEIRPTNVSAQVIIQTSPVTCPLHEYQASINNRIFPSIFENFSVASLLPNKRYNLSLNFQRTNETLIISFKTLEGSPSKVRNLAVLSRSSTETTITWDPPEWPNGKIKHYRVTYMHYRYLGCKNPVINNESFKEERTSDQKYTIKELIPYSEYIIQVDGVTTMDGDKTQISVFTLQDDASNNEELPPLVTNQQFGHVLLSFNQNCTKMRGPLTYHATLCCSNEWCTCINSTLTTVNNANAYIRFKVLAYSDYDLEVKVQRTNGSYFKQTLTQNFKSQPTAPHEVRNLTLYTKTETSASLRWRPPYPPTGILKDYLVIYICTTYWCTENHQIIIGDPCKIWPEFLCATIIIKEKENYKFNFNVYARNEMPEEYGMSSSVYGQLTVEKPGSPKNLTTDWDDYHNLTLSWIHPDITNGPLTDFVIRIINGSHRGKLPPQKILKYKEQLQYSYTVKDAPPSSNITVMVAARTKAGESSPIQNVTYSPPKPPKFSGDPRLDKADNRTLTMIIPEFTDLVEDNSILYIIVTELNPVKPSTPGDIPEHIVKLADVDTRNFSWIAKEIIDNYTENVQIGSKVKTKSYKLNLDLDDRELKMGTNYTITFLLSNTYMNKTRSSVKKILCMTAGMYQGENGSKYLGLVGLLVLPLLCFVGFILLRKYKISIKLPVRPIAANLRNLGGRSNPDVIPLAEAEQPQTRLQPIRPKPKPPTAAKPSNTKGGAKYSRLIKLVDFEGYVKEAIETGELELQHAMFPRGQTHPWDHGIKPFNKSKNRYNNLAAYDHTRVKLEMVDGNVTTDYINANYIEGFNAPRAYIATQGPKLATVDDFWRMIWQEGVEYIIMLANVFENGKKKVEKYWPDINQTLEFGPIQVHYVSVEVFADYESRKFSVTCDGQERKIKQYHFMSWPDHGVPLYAQSLVPLLRKMLTIPHGKSPVVVHCSAGVGRTGTIILCDICLRMAARDGVVDVLYHLHKIREQRVNMVDNIEQYKLVHLVLIQCLIAPQTNLACTEDIGGVVEQILTGDALDFQIKYLDDTVWQDQAMRSKVADEVSPIYPQKNRFDNIVPDEISRVFLSRYPPSDESSSYINAVKVDGFQSVSKYVVTQQPLPNTLGDFWRLVYERNISVIVSLNNIDPTDKTCCQFWPTEAVHTLEPVPHLKVTYSDLMSDVDYDVISTDLVITDPEDTEQRVVKILDFKNWNYDQYHPESSSQMLAFLEKVNRLGKTSKCILVTCYDGARASGLFVALTFVIDKIKLEQECDVCLAVRNVRRNRNEFIRHKDQFAFLYNTAVEYVNSFKIYSNFVSGKKLPSK